MKYLITLVIFLSSTFNVYSTDPINQKTFFVSVELSYTFHDYIKQIEFLREGQSGGVGLMVGHRAIPFYGEYYYQTPITYRFRNNLLKESFQEIGIRYNMNALHYLIPYGVDPYIGIGLVMKTSELIQEGVNDPTETLKQYQSKSFKPKMSLGIRVGNRNITFGLQYDYLPSSLNLSNSEGNDLTLYNELHLVTVRVGFRLNNLLPNRIVCPRFNHKQKRTLIF